jgi:hypothetical protein
MWSQPNSENVSRAVGLNNSEPRDGRFLPARDRPAPKQGLRPTAHEIHIYREYLLGVQAALREPPAKAKTLLAGLEAKRASLNNVERDMILDPQKSNLVRIEVMAVRAELLQVVAAK